MNNVILISTNGFEGTWPAVEYGAWVAETIKADVTLLGVAESEADGSQARNAALEALLERAAATLSSRGLRHSIIRKHGKFEEVVPLVSREADGITVLGPLGRPVLQRLLWGRSIRGMLEAIHNPVLYVPRVRLPLRKLLICIGGLGYELTAEHLAVRLGVAAGAEATLLHVAPPVEFDYPTARVQREHWRDLDSTDSLLGRNLRAGLEAAHSAGMKAAMIARQGNVVEEIVAEIKQGAYDLVCMGSPHGVSGLRHLYEPNVTDEIADQTDCPLLTARHSDMPG